DFFKNQITFLSSAVSALNYAERIMIQSGSNTPVPWNTYNSTQDILNKIANITQNTNNGFSLVNIVRNLYFQLVAYHNNTIPTAAILFVTDTTTPGSTDGADLYAGYIMNMGVRITAILMGDKANQSTFPNITSNIIKWPDLTQPQPDNWDSLYAAAYGCLNPASTTQGLTTITTTGNPTTTYTTQTVQPGSSSTTTSVTSPTPGSSSTTAPPSSEPSTTTTTPTTTTATTTPTPTGSTLAPYIPCQSFIAFCTDNSNVLIPDFFKNQITFLSSAISALNHAERISVQSGSNALAPWNTYQNIQDILNQISTITQNTNNGFSLRDVLKSLYGQLVIAQNSTIPMAAILFVTDTTTPGSVDGTDPYAGYIINMGVRITAILMGDKANQSTFPNITSNIIKWPDLTQPQPDNWDSLSGAAYGCSNSVSTTQGPSTTTPIPTTTTTMVPYVPCQSLISFCFDVSNALDEINFFKISNFLFSAVNDLNHPERIEVQASEAVLVPWNNNYTIDEILGQISDLGNNDVPFSLLNVLKTLYGQ
ncbi:hypothetical protein FO519_010037, partial [Halicephalobus sp. NKZ332]